VKASLDPTRIADQLCDLPPSRQGVTCARRLLHDLATNPAGLRAILGELSSLDGRGWSPQRLTTAIVDLAVGFRASATRPEERR
jgi:hypothetical protein